MLNFIKKNKYKIIILPIILLLGIFIGGCSDSNATAKDNTFSGEGPLTSTHVLIDNDTKQEYIVVQDSNGVAITPRLKR
ncbi:hypothetical protein [Limosilactobacillus reuteri]|uniref:hypothetical protein n=1 Tax=Limosilactobacillus reuteri TaxID=1598 RepID=UPI001C5ADCAC|nr:hypothetical protein [Limosilactobacillus reuteri]MBW3350638.1 hypothetical protein [Limosilactobacillus reuteri]UUW69681.1 hypothetical protein NUJ10_11625 [Limosilactobacillus reuteri]